MLLLSLLLPAYALAAQMIEALTLVPCQDNNTITTSKFSVYFWPENSTLEFDISVNLEIQGRVYADVSLYAYGFKIIHKTLNPCEAGGLKQLCPVYAGEIDLQSSATLGSDVLSQIPGIAFTFPNIDAYAIVKVYYEDTDQQCACVRLDLSNRKTVAQTAVKWVTAAISGVAMIGSFLFLYFGSIGTSQHIFAVSSLMFQYFQSQALVNLEAVERVPPMANAWAENLSWSLGLIYNKTIQKAVRWYIQATGGNPSTLKIYPTISVLPQKIKRGVEALSTVVTPRVASWAPWRDLGDAAQLAHAMSKRENELAAEVNARSSSTLLVLRGIKRFAYDMGIEYTNISITAFISLWFFLFVVAVFFGVLWVAFWTLHKRSKDYFAHRHAAAFTPYIGSVFKGAMLYLFYLGYAPILTFATWQFIVRDSAAVVVCSCVLIVAVVVVMGMAIFKVLKVARRSIVETGTPAYLLYNDLHFRHRYSFLYSPFHAGYYWFLYVYFAAITVKSLVLGFAQGSGRAQGLVIWLIELVLLIMMCVKKPYFNKATNTINIAMQVIIMLNAFFYLFFSNLFTQPIAVNAVMGVIFFILNAIFSLILLLYVLIYVFMSIIRKNPDTHLAPARDDRMSFIDEKIAIPGDDAEFTALGAAARADHDSEVASATHNWFQSEGGAARNPFAGEHQPRRFASAGDLSLGSGASHRNSTLIDIPDIDAVDAQLGHRHTDSQTAMDVMSGLPGGNAPHSPGTPTFAQNDGLLAKKKWWGK